MTSRMVEISTRNARMATMVFLFMVLKLNLNLNKSMRLQAPCCSTKRRVTISQGLEGELEEFPQHVAANVTKQRLLLGLF